MVVPMSALRLSQRMPDRQVVLLAAQWVVTWLPEQQLWGMWCVAAPCGCWAVACHTGYCPAHSLNTEMRVMLLARDE